VVPRTPRPTKIQVANSVHAREVEKQKAKHKKPKPKQKQKPKQTKKQARWRSNLGHRAYSTRDGINFHIVMVTRWLPDGCEPSHTTRYTLNDKFYNNISLQ
jgi:hypothetical protein